ncbi:Hypothetical predicted protein [Paramuricea clavata]|uniref:Uncharacterized protein n=1 Tax=Paramuricea clavata TaxID=317549 RepID=A0A7D9K7M6_PARCT|nr:Hypothetical predicted protein [Paramuricea clavata]
MDEVASYEVKNLCGLMDAIFSEAVSDEIAKIRKEKCCDCKVDYPPRRHECLMLTLEEIKEKTGSTVIIIATTAGGVVFLCIVLIVLLIKYKRRKRAPKLSTLIVNESLTDETPQESLQIALPLDQLPTKATVVNREFHGDVATKADQSEDVSGQGYETVASVDREFYDDFATKANESEDMRVDVEYPCSKTKHFTAPS